MRASTILLLEFLHMAAWIEKRSMMVVSKFILKQAVEGGDHNSLTRVELENRAAKCSKEICLIFLASLEASGITLL
jgi:hypothetical protein